MERQPMRRCGKRYATRKAALASPAGKRPDRYVPRERCQCGSFHVRARRAATGPASRRLRRAGAATGLPKAPSGFTARVRLIVRTRAGHGDPDQARCECCGMFLGPRGGQFQHRDARGIGGSRNPVTNGPANAALLCGTPRTGCHGLCEARDRLMEKAGWWIRGDRDPRHVPVLRWTPDGPAEAFLSEDGTYHDTPPGITEAAA